MRIFRYVCMLMIVVASSCNKDDVITTSFDDKNYRAALPTSAEQWSEVCEYTPAPGAYIHDVEKGGFTGEELTAETAAAYAERRMREAKFAAIPVCPCIRTASTTSWAAILLFVATPSMAHPSRVLCGLCRI